MSSNTATTTVATTGIWSDDRNTVKGPLSATHTVATAVGILQNKISKHVTAVYDLKPPLNPLAIQAKYFPGAETSDPLSVCSSTGLIALFTPNAETNHRIQTHLARKAQANQTSVEHNTTVATDSDTATTSQSSSTPAAPRRKSKKSKKRNPPSAANPPSTSNPPSTANLPSTANSPSTANPPQATMDSQLKEMLAFMQNQIAEIQGKNEKILNENGSMHNEIKSMRSEIDSMRNENARILKENARILLENGSIRNENTRILNENGSLRNEIESIRDENERILNENEKISNDLTSLRNDLEAEKAQHAQDLEALKEVTLLLIPLHLRVLLDLARTKVLEHLGHETWEGLRGGSNVCQLADTIFNELKRGGVSHHPSRKSISFLCSYNNIRRAGNIAAHSAKEDEVRNAVTTQSLESHDRQCLENLFSYAYNGAKV